MRITNRYFCVCTGGDKESSVIAALRKELDKKGIGVAAFDWPAHGKSMAKDEDFRVETCLAYLDHTERFLLEESGGPKGIETDV